MHNLAAVLLTFGIRMGNAPSDFTAPGSLHTSVQVEQLQLPRGWTQKTITNRT